MTFILSKLKQKSEKHCLLPNHYLVWPLVIDNKTMLTLVPLNALSSLVNSTAYLAKIPVTIHKSNLIIDIEFISVCTQAHKSTIMLFSL